VSRNLQRKKIYVRIIKYYSYKYLSLTYTHMNSRILGTAMVLTLTSGILLNSAYATTIGTGTVQGSGALTSVINWNDTFTTGAASGTINGIVVRGRILPTLNMTISGSGDINLGNLSSTTTATGTVNIEVGTNGANGASVTAKSTNGGMVNISNSGILINNLTTDGAADSYRFVTALTGTGDSTAPGFTQSGSVSQEMSNTTPLTIYTSNKPQQLQNVDDFSFSVAAKPNDQTAAGDYRDLVVLTITGNF
jgi:hypothetical protein